MGPVAAQHPLGSAGVGGRTEAQNCVHTVAVVIGTIGTKKLGIFQHVSTYWICLCHDTFWIILDMVHICYHTFIDMIFVIVVCIDT